MATLQPDMRSRLRAALSAASSADQLYGDACGPRARILSDLIACGLDQLPQPGQGNTLERWRVLGEVAGVDLSLAKLFEGHTDALAIMAELEAPAPAAGSSWGMWAAEAPPDRVVATIGGELPGSEAGVLILEGTKRWCSGAAHVTHGLLTVWTRDDDAPWLAAVAMDQPGVKTSEESWQAVGMAASGSIDVHFSGARATRIGRAGDYLRRPGFWHGGAGIAACWHAAAAALGKRLLQAMPTPEPPWHRTLAAGQIDVALSASASALREAATAIDAAPSADSQRLALRARAIAEHAVATVQAAVTRALGAAPLCRDRWFARMAADLPVFVRQSHGDRDLSALGTLIAQDCEDSAWPL